MSRLADEGKAQLRLLLEGEGALKLLLEDLEEEARSVLGQILEQDLDDPVQLARVRSTQGTVRGYLACIDRVKEIING